MILAVNRDRLNSEHANCEHALFRKPCGVARIDVHAELGLVSFHCGTACVLFERLLTPLDSPSPAIEQLEQRLRDGDQAALGELFQIYRDRLKKIARFRLDYRLANRVSESDVLQEAFIAAAKRIDYFGKQENVPAFLWMRMMVQQQLIDLFRQHITAGRRDVRREATAAFSGASPHTSMALAAQLVQSMTGVSEAISKAEQIEKLERTLERMDEVDREVIALRHFEELSNIEAAQVLNIAPPAASKRYIRAMARLSEILRAPDSNQPT